MRRAPLLFPSRDRGAGVLTSAPRLVPAVYLFDAAGCLTRIAGPPGFSTYREALLETCRFLG